MRGSGSRLPLGAVAYALLQLAHSQPRPEDSYDEQDFLYLPIAEKFLVSYLSKWSADTACRHWSYPPQMMHTHSIRYFEITHSLPAAYLLSFDSIPVPRETGRFTRTEAYLHERRVSLALVTEYSFKDENRFPCFTIVTLAEDKNDLYDRLYPGDSITGGHFSGIHLFINAVISAIDQSCGAWEGVLTNLDTELNITVRTQLALGDSWGCRNIALKSI
jgi:hypothetical protein